MNTQQFLLGKFSWNSICLFNSKHSLLCLIQLMLRIQNRLVGFMPSGQRILRILLYASIVLLLLNLVTISKPFENMGIRWTCCGRFFADLRNSWSCLQGRNTAAINKYKQLLASYTAHNKDHSLYLCTIKAVKKQTFTMLARNTFCCWQDHYKKHKI